MEWNRDDRTQQTDHLIKPAAATEEEADDEEKSESTTHPVMV